MMTEIREIRNAELLSKLNEEIQTLHFDLHPEIFKPYNQKEIEHYFENLLEDHNSKAFAAFLDGNAVGYVLMVIKDFKENPFQHSRKYVELDQIFVSKKHKGIGKLLVEKVIQETKSAGIDRIELNHWTSNSAARIFFQKNGFKYFNERMCFQIKL